MTEHNSGQTLILQSRPLVMNIFQPPRSSCSFRLYISPSLWVFVKSTWVMRTEWAETFRPRPARKAGIRAVRAGAVLVVDTWESEEKKSVLPLTHETIRAKRFTGCPRHFVPPPPPTPTPHRFNLLLSRFWLITAVRVISRSLWQHWDKQNHFLVSKASGKKALCEWETL